MSPLSRITGIAVGLLAGAALAAAADAPSEQESAGSAQSSWCRAFIEGYTSQPSQSSAAVAPERRVAPAGVAQPAARPGSTGHAYPALRFVRLECPGSGRPAASPRTFVPEAPPGSGVRVYPSLPWLAPGLRSYADAMIPIPECAPAPRTTIIFVAPGCLDSRRNTLRFLAPRAASLP